MPPLAATSFAPGAFAPGQFVRHRDRPDWGLGQVQSALGNRVTVNFEHAGKVLINAAVVQLEVLSESDLDREAEASRSVPLKE